MRSYRRGSGYGYGDDRRDAAVAKVAFDRTCIWILSHVSINELFSRLSFLFSILSEEVAEYVHKSIVYVYCYDDIILCTCALLERVGVICFARRKTSGTDSRLIVMLIIGSLIVVYLRDT